MQSKATVELEKTPKEFNNNIQKYARIFFSNKNERNFSPVYNELLIIAKSACGSILKRDEEAMHDIINKVAMTIWQDNRIYSEEKSFLSWVFVACKNGALAHIKNKKKKKEILASDMIFGEGEEEDDAFERIVSKISDSSDSTFQDRNDVFHESYKMQHDFILETLGNLYSGEEYEILYKAIVEKQSPEKIAMEHGINSRITITSRNRRARNIIKEKLEEKLEESKISEDKSLDSEIKGKTTNGNYFTCFRVSGLFQGEYKEYSPNGELVTVGNFEKGEKVGDWISFNKEGIKIKKTDYDRGSFVKYDRFGIINAIGLEK